MSWFDTSGFANIAKSALKEAQRTIDKALDIRDDNVNTVPANTPVDSNSEDFFGSWGLSQINNTRDLVKGSPEEIITKSPTKSKMSTSLWGSFTGSFFEAPKEEIRPKDVIDGLDDSVDLGSENFSSSKLVVQQNDDGDSVAQRLSTCEVDGDILLDKNIQSADSGKNSTNKEGSVDHLRIQLVDGNITKRDRSVSTYNNRLSVISCESDKKSSESVEVLSGTECTTSPDSDALSFGLSTSTASSGLRQTSDSVEVLLDSLTSPSSVEVLDSNSSTSRRQSQLTDEFISPLESPEENFSAPEKTSPDSVDVIREELEENSVADDTISYTSISESTAATVLDSAPILIMKHQKSLKESIKSEIASEIVSHELPLSADKNVMMEPVTSAPSRSGLLLPVSQINLISTQPQSTKQDISNLLKTSNVIDIPQDSDSLISIRSDSLHESNDEGSQSDKTLIASDNIMESSSDTSSTTDSNCNSTYLKHMLADAMTEKSNECDTLKKTTSCKRTSDVHDFAVKHEDMLESIPFSQINCPQRETSPLSSESRSDLVKIGSDQTSGHTSGDELETTTSSDIEIISSPNGDSSSTHSRHSPSKVFSAKVKVEETNVDVLLGKMTFKKMKGHNRELSEASSISDDSEIERLVKRISEITEILESREAKLVEVSRRNAELQEINVDFKHQIDMILNKEIESVDLSQVTEEYTQRLSALERKFQQAIREKDFLRKQLDQCKLEATLRVSKSEIDSIMLEKDEIIKELREEGEKLSKQQLQHSNIIKKLRAKEKENEGTIKHLKESLEDLTSETDRLKRSLTAKEEVERTQIEAVHQLTAKNKKFEQEVSQLQGHLDDLTQKYETVKKSLDAAKKELIDKNRTSTELLAREQMLESLENEKRITESQNEEIINQLDDLRSKLRQADQEYLKKEQTLRFENGELLRRLEDAERRNEELSQSVLEVSKPLVRQLESVQAAHNMKLASFEKIEQGLLLKINDLHSRLQTATETERHAREECILLKSKLSTAESQLNAALHEADLFQVQLEQQKTERIISEQELKREISTLQHNVKYDIETVENLKKEVDALQHRLSIEKVSNEAEKRRNDSIQEQIREKNDILGNLVQPSASPGNTSPTLSLGRVSLSESLGSSLWLQDDPFESGAPARCTNMLEMQLLQTNLKHRDGEVQQLQWELNRREHERSLLNSEISNLISRIEVLESKLTEHAALKTRFVELQQQYDTLCQLYGEKVEETEELKLDLQDVKEMYKSQIDELLKQQKENS